MAEFAEHTKKKPAFLGLPRNVWAVSLASFFMDVSSEMVINILPLFLANVLGIRTELIGVIEGIAEATSSILKLFSGWFSDKLRARKWLAVAGYGISALSKPFFYIASSWEAIAAARWSDRVGKGIRTSPRDALVVDSVSVQARGRAFGLHRAMDTAGAMVGLLIALGLIWLTQASSITLSAGTFRKIVLISLLPAFLAVFALIIGTQDVPVKSQRSAPRFAFRGLGQSFMLFIFITGVFTLGNSSDAFLVLRTQERGLSVTGILGVLAVFNLIYALVSTPAGVLSDRIGRRRLIIGGWLVYALIYFGFSLAGSAWHVWVLYGVYGLYYGMAYGTSRALIADLVPEQLRATAYGTYDAVVGILAFPASLIAGILWQGIGNWGGLGPSAPFTFGGLLALLAAILLAAWKPQPANQS